MKNILNTAGRIIDTVTGFLGGLILAVLLVVTVATSIRILGINIERVRIVYAVTIFALPFIGARFHSKFSRFFASLFTFFASDGGGGHMGGDTHDRWRDLVGDICYVISIIFIAIAFLFSARIPLVLGIFLLASYITHVMREKTPNEITTPPSETRS